MRPISLTLQAFGSYAGEVDVDFARLSRHGVFSISGPTGAGKSTIFDAMVYALYDDLPGFRVDGNVRSQFADPSTPTRVSFDFVVYGEHWRIERRPTQLVRRRRGDGAPIERKSTVVLGRVGEDGELVAGSCLTRKDEVRRRVDALIGLSKDQFEQVVLIPQGRFEEVLKADTSKRAPLLRRLFPIEVFTALTESLRSIAQARQSEYEEAARAQAAVGARLREAYEAAVRQLPEAVRSELFGGGDGDGVPDEGDGEPDEGTGGVLGADRGADRGAVRGAVRGADSVPGAGPLGAGPGAGPLGAGPLEACADRLAEALRRVDELVTELASRSETARTALADARRAAAEWDRWQEDLALAASFAEEERHDREEVALLERARRISDLRAALYGWNDARSRLEVLEPEIAALVGTIDAVFHGEPDPAGFHGEPDPAGLVRQEAWAAARADAHSAGVLAERLAADAHRLESEVARFQRLDQVGRSLVTRDRALVGRRVELDELALKLDAEEQAVVLMADEARRLRTEVASLDALSEAVAALEREHVTASRRAAAIAGVERLEGELAAANAEATRAAAAVEAVRASWRGALAGRLARLLEDGAPCPTCGAIEHPMPAVVEEDGADDEELAAAEAAQDEALRRKGAVEREAAAARGAIDALAATRPVHVVEADLAAHRDALALVHDAAARLEEVASDERRRREALLEARQVLSRDRRMLDDDWARVEVDRAAHERDAAAFVELHGALESPAPRAAALAAIGADVERLAGLLRKAEAARAELRNALAFLDPVIRELHASDPKELFAWLMDPSELDARSAGVDERRRRREEVRRRISAYEMAGAGRTAARPDLSRYEAHAESAAREHVSLVERRGVLADRVAVVAAGPSEWASAGLAVDAARRALEQAKTVADRCAGLGGGPSSLRLSLENWVLADYLRQVLVQANQRLDVMTDGRFALQLSDGVTDGRKPWGLDLSVFDASTGGVRPATTLSGGETFMAALALALGLADVVSCGSNREVGALFVDEGFGSLDPQALDAVVDVLRSLEDGGRVVGVISHVRELQHALPSGILVEPSAHGSVVTFHYPPG